MYTQCLFYYSCSAFIYQSLEFCVSMPAHGQGIGTSHFTAMIQSKSTIQFADDKAMLPCI
jgi:hypothetical protein